MATTNRHFNIAIPTLERDNFEEWYLLVKAYARTSGISYALQQNVDLSKLQEAKQHTFWNLSFVMKASVGKELSHLVKQMSKLDEWHYPHNIIARIKREIRPHAAAQ